MTEADLHAFADGVLEPARHAEIAVFLAAHPDERLRVDDWREQNRALKAWLDPVLTEPLPLNLPLTPAHRGWNAWPWRSLAAGLAIAVVSAGSAWWGRGMHDGQTLAWARIAPFQTSQVSQVSQPLQGFAHRAAVAHLVYSPEVRRPVEVGADQEQALVTWLTKRLGATVRPPDLSALGYSLIGGRLLPGDKGPVAQFMFGGPKAERLTLYITREDAGRETAFRFGQDGAVNVFYWVDKDFGYAISSGESRQEMVRVADAVYRQLDANK